MPPKDLAPFSYISPQKNPLSTIKYELTIESFSANGKKSENGKNGPTHEPHYLGSV